MTKVGFHKGSVCTFLGKNKSAQITLSKTRFLLFWYQSLAKRYFKKSCLPQGITAKRVLQLFVFGAGMLCPKAKSREPQQRFVRVGRAWAIAMFEDSQQAYV